MADVLTRELELHAYEKELLREFGAFFGGGNKLSRGDMRNPENYKLREESGG